MKYIKRLINTILIITILLTNFIPFIEVSAAGCNYTVKVAKSDGTEESLGCFVNYTDAKNKMNSHNSTSSQTAVIYNSNNKMVNVKYGMAKLHTGNVIYLYPTASSSSNYTSVHSRYGRDAAFIDYDPNSNRVKIKISGYAGWTHIDNIQIIPITDVNTQSVQVLATTCLRVRPKPTTTTADKDQIGCANKGSIYRYYDKTTAEGFTWYKIKYDGVFGWIASLSGWTTETTNSLQTYYEANTEGGNLIHYFEHNIDGPVRQSYTNLGTYPNFMIKNQIYYSFDGNYFYQNLVSMLDDYRENATKRAVNKTNPHFPYYMYLPTHSKTGYTANDFNFDIINKGFTRNIDPSITYVRKVVDEKGNPILNQAGQLQWEWVPGINRKGISLLYNEGKSIIDVANTYGINAIMMYGTALNESGNGKSLIAFLKKNLFGIGAVDSNPVNGARNYATVKDSMIGFAELTGSKYSNPYDGVYHGSHYGNKASGMNIRYATDPYWGEKQATASRALDKNFGMNDFMANTIGVKLTSEAIPVMKEPNNDSQVIYKMQNSRVLVEKMPLIVFDKVYTTVNNVKTGWYKVYTDVALDDNQNINPNLPYMFDRSYGYVREDYLYVSNNQPVINAKDIIIRQNEVVNIVEGVTASDVEDGNLTNRIKVVESYNNKIPGEYFVTYTVEDNQKFQVSKEVKVTVLPAEEPYIIANNKTIPQFTTFDPKIGVSANDYIDGDITDNIEIIYNDVNPEVLGDYKVKYRVTNNAGLFSEKEITVAVVPNQAPVIHANNKTIKLNDSFDPKVGVSVTDLEEGNITDRLQVLTNTVNTGVIGTYKVVYEVVDSANNKVTKEVFITVEERNYITKKGEFYFESMDFNQTTNKLDVSGYLAITGINNTKETNISYDLIIKNNFNNHEIIKSLDRWIVGNPNRSYNDGIYNYSATWFKGNVDLSDIPMGEYTLYVRARSGNYESINLFRNVFNKKMTRKATDKNGNGYLFRNNNYKSDYPLELFVSQNGLISTVEPPHTSNMFNNYQKISFNSKYLNILGMSYNINGNYSKTSTVTREMIFENIYTGERFTYNIGSIVGAEIPLRVSDGKSKARGWFDTTNKIDVSTIPAGEYIIFIRTKVGTIDDYGELNDIFLKNITAKTIVNNKQYNIKLNKNARFRLELSVKNI